VGQKSVKVCIAGAEYEQEIIEMEEKYSKGVSIFYSSNNSTTPYLILRCSGYLVTECRLVSLGDANLPSEMFLRLSQAVLKAHSDGIVLGPSLNIGNLNWDVSNDVNGLPCVTFNNLPPPIAPELPPPPPPKWPVPELTTDSSGSTKETDIYVTPIVLFQVINDIEYTVRDATGALDFNALPPTKQVSFLDDKPEIPAVIQKDEGLLHIVQGCLSPDPTLRPDAASLCKSLLRLCRMSILRDLVHYVGKSFCKALRRLTIH